MSGGSFDVVVVFHRVYGDDDLPPIVRRTLGPEVPLVVCSAGLTPEAAEKCIVDWAPAYYVKVPLNVDSLVETVRIAAGT